MAKGLSAAKAKKILEDGTVRGKALTEKQKKFFGAVAGGATPLKKLNGGWLDKFAMGGSLPGASGMMYGRTSGSPLIEPGKAQKGGSIPKAQSGVTEGVEPIVENKKELLANSDLNKGYEMVVDEKQFLKNWINSNRFKTKLPQNLKEIDSKKGWLNSKPFFYNFEEDADDITQKSLNSLDSVKVFGNPNSDFEQELSDKYAELFKETEFDTYNRESYSRGSYSPGDHSIWLNTNNTGTKTHELTHSTPLDDIMKHIAPVSQKFTDLEQEYIKQYKDEDDIKMGYQWGMGPFLQSDTDTFFGTPKTLLKGEEFKKDVFNKGYNYDHLKYLDRTTEVYSRIMSIRRRAGLKPEDHIDKKKMKEVLEKTKGEDLYDVYSEDQVREMLNKMASNTSNTLNKNVAQNGKVIYGSPEYEKLYNEGSIAGVDADGNPTIALDEVNLTVDKRTGKNILEDYPYYNDLTKEDLKYFRDPGPIGTAVRRKAYTKRGLAEDTRDMVTGMLVQQPLSALQAPQSLMVEGIEALRGRDANFLNALTFDTQRTPSQLYGFETTSDMSWYNPKVISNFAMDAVSDPMNLVGAGIVDDALKLGLRQGLKNTVARSLDTPIINTLGNKYLPNAYKVNPWAFKANPQAYYHRSPDLNNIINRESGMLQGFGESKAGKLYTEFAASNPGGGINLRKGANNQLYFSKGVPLDYGRYNPKSLGMSGQGYRGPYIAEVEGVPMGSSYKGRAPKSTPPSNVEGYAVSRRPIALDEANFYKEDWLRGYKPIEIPQAPSSFVEAAVNPGVRQSLKDLNDELGIVNTTSAQIRASEKFNKNWFNNPETIRRVEEMINQPTSLRSNMSETEILQDLNLYETMLDKSPNLTAAQKAGIERQKKDLYAALANKNLQTVQQKGRFTEVFDPDNIRHQDVGLTYEENPNYLGFYTGRTNKGTVNVPRTKEFNKDVGSVFTHEDLHAVTAGRKGYTDEATQILNDAVSEDQDWWLNIINTEKDPKVRAKLIDRLEYLSRPQEIHARVHELRKAFNLKPGQEVSPSKIEAIMTKGLKGETPVSEAFFRLLGDKEKFRKIFNKLPAFVPGAVGVGAATQMKDGGRCWPGYKAVAGKTPFSKGSCQKAEDGGWLDKFQEGGVIEDDRGQWAYPGEITKINSNNITMKGVNYPVLGISDTGDKKMMQPGKDYKFDGNSVTEYPMAQKGMNVEGQKQKKWFDSYLRSDKYLERLGKEFPEMNADQLANERWARLMNMRSTPIGFLPESSEISPEPGSTQGVYDADEYPGKIMLRPEYSEGRQGPWSYNTIPLHELGHAVDEGGKRIPQTTLDFLMPKLKQNPYDIPKERFYYTHPTEYINRLQPLRYLLQEEGIYDTKKKDFTKEDLQKAKENTRIKYNTHFKDLMENTESEEDFIEIMNTIAARPQMQQDTMVAKDGKSLVELNQLTNFTNYNTPQPGGWLDKYH